MWPYEKNKNVYKELSKADFIVFFNIILIPYHNAIATENMIKVGKINPWSRSKWMFWWYTKNTGNKAIKTGCMIKFLEFSCKFIYVDKSAN